MLCDKADVEKLPLLGAELAVLCDKADVEKLPLLGAELAVLCHKADVEKLPLLGAELAALCGQCKIKDEFQAFLAKLTVQTVAQFASNTDDEKNLKTDVFDMCEVELNFGDRTNLRWA